MIFDSKEFHILLSENKFEPAFIKFTAQDMIFDSLIQPLYALQSKHRVCD